MVCWFHLTHFLPEGWVRWSGLHGHLGVQIFFVISGFVIPYSLSVGQYRLPDYRRFILKRLIRLDPPYLVSVLLAAVVSFAVVRTGNAISTASPTCEQILLHFGFLNAFASEPWLSAVYWTLAIEFQFYLFIGLAFPLLATRSFKLRASTFLCLSSLAVLLPQKAFMPAWLFHFMLGIVAFQYRRGIISLPGALTWGGVVHAGAWWSDGGTSALVACATFAIIAFVDLKYTTPPVAFLGKISYSLYLVHYILGPRIINIGLKFVTTYAEKLALLALTLSLCGFAAYLLWKYVEQPMQMYAARIRYSHSK